MFHQDITKRILAEEELKISEQKFRHIFNSSNDAFFIHDLQGNFLEVNETACRILGYSREEFLRMSVEDIDTPEMANQAQDKIKQVEQDGEMIFETAHIRRDKTRVPVEINSRKIQYNEQDCILSVVRDITKRKQFEQALRDSEETYRNLFHNAQVGLIRSSLEDGKILECNEQLAKMFGFDNKEEIINKFLISQNYVDPDRREIMKQEILEKGEIENFESKFYRRDGSVFWGLYSARLYPEKGWIEGVIEDITERKQDEQELVRMKQQSQAALKEIQELVNSISSLLISLDHNWCIYRWNNAAEEILGISKEKAKGLYLNQCPVSWEWEKIENGLRESMDRREQVRVEDISYLTADNVNGFLSITIHPILEEGDAPLTGLLILGSDITEKKLMESQFLQDQKMDAIGQLAAGIAHEINTPIQYVDGNTNYLKDVFQDILGIMESYSQLLEVSEKEQIPASLLQEIKNEQENLDLEFLREDIPNSLNESLEGLQKVAKIVRSMKNFAHPGESDKVQVDINKALEDTITICKNEWKYSADVITDYDPDLPLVPCFKDEINQVFLNLIVNSAQAIGESGSSDGKGKGTINVSTHNNTEYAEVRISDTGPGIPEHIRDRIFNPFFTTKEVGKGSGQGLYIAYNIITERHQGTMNFESRVGKGTTFFIKFPLKN